MVAQPLIEFPNAEGAALAYLREAQAAYKAEHLDDDLDVDLGSRNPAGEVTVEFARVRRVGGSSTGRRIDLAMLDVLVWADDHARRMRIAQRLRAHLHAASGSSAGGARIGGCTDVLAPRRMPDPGNAQAEVVMFTVQLAMHVSSSS